MSELAKKIRSVRCPRAAAVIVAAGSGTRFGGDKLWAELAGVPVLVRTLQVFERAPLVDEIVLVVPADAVEETTARLAPFGFQKLARIVPGGAARSDSCFAGVLAASPRSQIIAIHDGARPLVTDAVVEEAIWEAYRRGAAVPAVPVRDTVKLALEHIVTETPERSRLFAVQTPQCFRREIIRAALLAARQDGAAVTDDAAAVERVGGPVWLTAGSEDNIKITTPLDLSLAELILQGREAPCASDTDTTPTD